jgi:hypothetical protein
MSQVTGSLSLPGASKNIGDITATMTPAGTLKRRSNPVASKKFFTVPPYRDS